MDFAFSLCDYGITVFYFTLIFKLPDMALNNIGAI